MLTPLPPFEPTRAPQLLSVIDVNEAPVFHPQVYALDVGASIRVNLIASDPDSSFKPEFSRLNYTIVTTNDTSGYFLLDPVSGVFSAPPLNLDLDPTKNAFYFLVSVFFDISARAGSFCPLYLDVLSISVTRAQGVPFFVSCTCST